MKKVYGFIVCGLLAISPSFSQCDHDQYKSDCIAHLNEDHFTFVKEFEVHSKNGETVEHSFVLSDIADYEYYFTGDDWSHHTMEATLYDENHKKISSNHPTTKDFLHAIKFTCTKTGVYYIKFTFDQGESFCGSAVIGFHKHTKK